jgi:hypothetical protein
VSKGNAGQFLVSIFFRIDFHYYGHFIHRQDKSFEEKISNVSAIFLLSVLVLSIGADRKHGVLIQR